ncbi:MAG: class I SAM-dependent methyltransferase [Polyangiaceae bacterium]|nr:class I SAM-dependent methyltransferase [Polyangiaceae bacterium]
MAANHEYDDGFFQYINAGSLAAARVVCPMLVDWLKPRSVLDVGCGAGAWCRVWLESGVPEVLGVDGEYVNRASLLVAAEHFRSFDLSQRFDVGRRFDLVTSLEVAEHIPAASADAFVDNLVAHGKVVLFSAAVPGQGGEFHVNEQPLEYWRARFTTRGYRCFDPLRSRLLRNPQVEPWYRYNTLLYVAPGAVASLPEAIMSLEVRDGRPIPELSPLRWRTRNAVLRAVPTRMLDLLVAAKHEWVRRTRSRRT